MDMASAHESWTVLPHGPIEKLTENLWRVEGSLPHMSLKRVMCVAKLTDGRLLVHNAIALADDAMREVEAWGEPAFLVVPNGWHRLDAKVFKKRYASIQVVCPAGSRKKVEQVVPVDLTYDRFPGDNAVRVEHAQGVRDAEGVMRVVSSDGLTLVFNDLIFNLAHGSGIGGLVFRLLGSTGGPRVTGIMKRLVVKDRPAFRDYLERLASEPLLRRIIVSHGAPITDSAASTLRDVASRL
jgi:hypothetical protein